MITATGNTARQSNRFLVRRARVLRAINRLHSKDFSRKARNDLLIECAEIPLLYSDFCAGWVGKCNPEEQGVTPLAFLHPGGLLFSH